MRISDWSSDVCSSDLRGNRRRDRQALPRHHPGRDGDAGFTETRQHLQQRVSRVRHLRRADRADLPRRHTERRKARRDQRGRGGAGAISTNGARSVRDRKSVVSGTSVSVRLALGGRRLIKKKKQSNTKNNDLTTTT